MGRCRMDFRELVLVSPRVCVRQLLGWGHTGSFLYPRCVESNRIVLCAATRDVVGEAFRSRETHGMRGIGKFPILIKKDKKLNRLRTIVVPLSSISWAQDARVWQLPENGRSLWLVSEKHCVLVRPSERLLAEFRIGSSCQPDTT